MLHLITVSLFGAQANNDFDFSRFISGLESKSGDSSRTTSAPEDDSRRSKCAGKCVDLHPELLALDCADGRRKYVCTEFSNPMEGTGFVSDFEPICSWSARDCAIQVPDLIPDRFQCPEVTCPVGYPLVLDKNNCKRCARFVDFATCCEAGCTPFDGCNKYKCLDDGSVDYDYDSDSFECLNILQDENKLCVCAVDDVRLSPSFSTQSAGDIVKIRTYIEKQLESKSQEEKDRIKAEYEAVLREASNFVTQYNARQQTTSMAIPDLSQEQLLNFDMDKFKNVVKALYSQQKATDQAFFKSQEAFFMVREKYGVNTTADESLCATLENSLKRDCKQVLAGYSNLKDKFDAIPEQVREALGNLASISERDLESFFQFSNDQIASTASKIRRNIEVVSEQLIKVDKLVKRTICREGAAIANSVSLRRFAKLISNSRNATARQIFRKVSTLVSKPIQNLRQYCRAPDSTPLRFNFKRRFTQWLITGNYSDARQAFERIKTKFADVSDSFCDDCQCGNETSISRCLALGENCVCLPQIDTAIPKIVAVAQLPNKTIEEIRTRLAQTFQRLGGRVKTVVKLTRQDDSARRRLGAKDGSVVYKVDVETQQSNLDQGSDVNTEADATLGQYGAVVGTEEQNVDADDIKVLEEDISPQQSSTTTSAVPVSGASSIVFAEAVLFAAAANVFACL